MDKGIVIAKYTKFGLIQGKEYRVLAAGKTSVNPTIFVIDSNDYPVEYGLNHFEIKGDAK